MEQQNAHILVVEDEADLAHLVQVNLELSGYEVSVAADGRAGLEAARRVDPDLVLLDVMMPELDGWQVLRALKEDQHLHDVPVIMLTALSEERDLIRGHLNGAVQYVTKPFEMRRLMESVEHALEKASDEEQAERRQRTRSLLKRLAELDSGRSASGTPVRLSRLENPPEATREQQPAVTEAERDRLESLTDKQRDVAVRFVRGQSAREIADDLDVSRSNVYATRKRIARKLGVTPDEVAEEAERLGIIG